MNKRKAMELLRMYLEGYVRDSFMFHTKFVDELNELIAKSSGCEKEIFSLLIKQLCFVKQLGENVHMANSNEILRHQLRSYYSLHIKGKGFNIRLLMAFKSKGRPLFLAAFDEKEGKKSTNYSKTVFVLETRYNEV